MAELKSIQTVFSGWKTIMWHQVCWWHNAYRNHFWIVETIYSWTWTKLWKI